jgi:hypothetical protein
MKYCTSFAAKCCADVVMLQHPLSVVFVRHEMLCSGVRKKIVLEERHFADVELGGLPFVSCGTIFLFGVFMLGFGSLPNFTLCF